jgi:hypothetical protein
MPEAILSAGFIGNKERSLQARRRDDPPAAQARGGATTRKAWDAGLKLAVF